MRRILAHRKLALVVPAGIGLGLGFCGYSTAPSRYYSEAVLVLDARKIQALPTESVVSPLPQDSPVLRSELDIISSNTMAGKVISKLSPETLDLIRKGGPQLSIRQVLSSLLKAAPAKEAAPKKPIDDPNDTTGIEGALLFNLGVANDGRSYTIFISYSASHPKAAAEIANAFAESYLDYQVDIKGAGTRQVSDWLGQKLVTMRASLENSERALNDFRGSANLVAVNGATQQAQRVTAAQAELVAAKAVLAAAQARLDTANRQLSLGDELTVADNGGATLIQNLKAEQYGIERKMREITDEGALKSAELPSLRSQFAVVQEQLNAATQRVIYGLSAEVDIAQSRTTSAEKALADAKAELQAADKARVQEAQLEREAAANRTIYESYLARYKQTIEQDGIAAPDARIISRAAPSSLRASPKLQNWLLFGLIMGSAFGFGLAFLRELTDKRIRSAASLAEQTGYPVLGAIPSVPFSGRNQPASVISNPRFGEALVALQAGVRLAQQARGARVIAIASSRIGEGKTTVTANLARSLAAAGTKVLAIDCNFSRPALSKLFAVTNAGNFEAVIVERQNPNSLISLDSASGVSVMSGSAGSTSSGLLLANKNFRGMLATLRERFDVILMDGPALSQSLDAWQIAAMADGVIMAVCKSKSRIDVTKSNLDRLTDYGCPVLGIVIDRHMDRAILPHTLQLAPASERGSQEPKSWKIYDFPEVAQST